MKSPLRLARKGRCMTIAHVCVLTEINPSSLSRIERGRQTPSKELTEKLVKFFDNEVSEIQILYPERYVEKSVA
ncbi:helix-turn-helix transcriptional regulator [Mycoavidus sp. SF9855]|uniref:helix-turn-helix domain-containing protein n=1 Tax=Mycoavidus sp. SF9855 TaxID=2968475 RepID=UPI00211CE7A5|nr:helix-turn-helix transcriptional regulator [Mycoavidus sp. SF9855]UUM20952.1 helix-turn-helix domain-containing protein [Mycoavidus sp. SF9855]